MVTLIASACSERHVLVHLDLEEAEQACSTAVGMVGSNER